MLHRKKAKRQKDKLLYTDRREREKSMEKSIEKIKTDRTKQEQNVGRLIERQRRTEYILYHLLLTNHSLLQEVKPFMKKSHDQTQNETIVEDKTVGHLS